MTHFLTRRDFLWQTALAAPALRSLVPWQEAAADLVIIGGGFGGCAAALGALRRGLRVIMTEETNWIGGQLTQQAVPPDENAWIETIGGTASYRDLRVRMRDYYRAHYPLTEKARATARLNPGNCWVSRIGCEPNVALAVLQGLLAPYEATGQLELLLEHVAESADVSGDRVRAISVRHLPSGRQRVLHAPVFADATELGELLPLTGTEFVIGAESRRETEEPDAPESAQPDNVQSFTVCFAMDYRPGEDHAIDRPADYAHWRDLVITDPVHPAHRLLSFDDPDSQRIGFDPVARTGYWSYRRIIDHTLFTPGSYASDITIVNWAHHDYSFGSLLEGSPAERAGHVARAASLSRSLLYWLQTEMPRKDGGIGWKGLRLRPDIVGTTDGMAKYPYIRESRRIRAEYTVRQQDVVAALRMQATGRSRETVRALDVRDSVGIGHYSMDLHRTTRGDRPQYGDTLPFQIPLGSLLPQRMENLLPACKNLGVTHMTNGCFRLHPIEWNIGEAVGELAAFAKARRVPLRAVRQKPALLGEYQRQLEQSGIRLAWPGPLPKPS